MERLNSTRPVIFSSYHYKSPLNIFYRVVLAVLLLGSLGGLNGCDKDIENQSPISLKANMASNMTGAGTSINNLQRMFFEEMYEQKLFTKLNDTADIYWQPRWQTSVLKYDSIGNSYTYIVLNPIIRSTKTFLWHDKIQVRDTRKYLIIRQSGSEVNFSTATYLPTKPKKGSPQQNVTEPRSLAKFTGVMLLEGLSSDEQARFIYKNGVLQDDGRKQAGKRISDGGITTSRYECTTYMVCTWSAACVLDGNFEVWGATTSEAGLNYCIPPYEPACGIGGSGAVWKLTSQKMQQQCYWVDDPPLPPSGGDGGGSGGGGSSPGGSPGTGEYINPSFEFTQGPTPPAVADYDCKQLRNTHPEDKIQGGNYTLEDFIAANKGKNRATIITQRSYQSLAGGLIRLSGGPTIRYIPDPLNPDVIIDLRHMLVVGYYGPKVGNSVEVMQGLGGQASAYDHQDYFSNQLGYDFYRNYGSSVASEPGRFLEFLESFLTNFTNARGKPNRSGGTHPDVINQRCP